MYPSSWNIWMSLYGSGSWESETETTVLSLANTRGGVLKSLLEFCTATFVFLCVVWAWGPWSMSAGPAGQPTAPPGQTQRLQSTRRPRLPQQGDLCDGEEQPLPSFLSLFLSAIPFRGYHNLPPSITLSSASSSLTPTNFISTSIHYIL